jgi:hypothetical protein
MEETADVRLLSLLRESQDRAKDLEAALRDVLHTIENVQTSGGWSAVEVSITKAKKCLRGPI